MINIINKSRLCPKCNGIMYKDKNKKAYVGNPKKVFVCSDCKGFICIYKKNKFI